MSAKCSKDVLIRQKSEVWQSYRSLGQGAIAHSLESSLVFEIQMNFEL